VPETTSSGAGFEGIETSVMGRYNRLGERRWKSRRLALKKRLLAAS
jgi:hypothetical protein